MVLISASGTFYARCIRCRYRFHSMATRHTMLLNRWMVRWIRYIMLCHVCTWQERKWKRWCVIIMKRWRHPFSKWVKSLTVSIVISSKMWKNCFCCVWHKLHGFCFAKWGNGSKSGALILRRVSMKSSGKHYWISSNFFSLNINWKTIPNWWGKTNCKTIFFLEKMECSSPWSCPFSYYSISKSIALVFGKNLETSIF